MFHARNLFVLETAEVAIELNKILRASRRDGTVPQVELFLKEAEHRLCALLVPKAKDEMVAVLSPENQYVSTRNRRACPLIEQFVKGRSQMLKGRTGFGNPVADLCEVWGVPDLDGLNQFFLCVRHLLMHVVQEASDLKDLYEDTRCKLEYLTTVGVEIEPLNDPTNERELSLDLFDNSGAVGWPVIRVVQLAAIEDPLKSLLQMTLNNPNVTIQWRTMEGDWEQEHADAIVAWQTHYGAMWGPFQ